MRNEITYKLLLSAAALVISTSQAMANDMFENEAFGYVDGDITQSAYFNGQKTLEVDVGSITAETASRVTALGEVRGDIYQHTDGYEDDKLVIQVGAVNADVAEDTMATGYVNGDIVQYDETGLNIIEARVGAVDAGEGYSYQNVAEGYVNGSILQEAYADGATIRARVGAISTELE